MSPEERARGSAASAFRRAGELSEAAAVELLCKRSAGRSLRRSRGAARELAEWQEEACAARVRMQDGRSALAAASDWEGARELTERALRAAERASPPGEDEVPVTASASPGAPEPGERDGSEAPSGRLPVGSLDPPSAEALSAWLDELEGGLATAATTATLETAALRVGRVESWLRTNRGHEGHEARLVVQAHAEASGCEGLAQAAVAEAWAGSELWLADGRALGERLGRAVRQELAPASRVPVGPRLLLAPEVVAELTFRMAPVLLGLEPGLPEASALRLPRGLSLVEDGCEDARPRDAVGRPLERLTLGDARGLVAPPAASLPFLRPGIADLPRRGWFRLSWLAPEHGLSDEVLAARLGTGLFVERARTVELDSASLRWRGIGTGWWVDGGRARRPLAGLPLDFELGALLSGLQAFGREPRALHPSGTVRALPWLVDLSAEGSGAAR